MIEPYWEVPGVTLYHGDCKEVLQSLPADSADCVITDPPYGLEFMGQDWDAPWKQGVGLGGHNAGFADVVMADGAQRLKRPSYTGGTNPTCRSCGGLQRGRVTKKGQPPCRCDAPRFDNVMLPRMQAFQAWVETWARPLLRVMKPGAYLLAFGGTRTYHRLTCALEDAGFEIRDCIQWLYGSGFPKSLDLGEGRGTALKPAHEPIVLARKPLIGTYAQNVLRWGTGGLNIDASRIGIAADDDIHAKNPHTFGTIGANGIYGAGKATTYEVPPGRWPANCVFSHTDGCVERGTRRVKGSNKPGPNAGTGLGYQGGDRVRTVEDYADPDGRETVPDFACVEGCPVRLLDEQSGVTRSDGGTGPTTQSIGGRGAYGGGDNRGFFHYADVGGASRFFYIAKSDRRERDLGCEHLPPKSPGETVHRTEGSAGMQSPRAGAGRTSGGRNDWPTVKPLDLMDHLIKLITPPGGTLLDPFLGSGSTGCSAMRLGQGYRFIGCDLDDHALAIAEARIRYWMGPLFAL